MQSVYTNRNVISITNYQCLAYLNAKQTAHVQSTGCEAQVKMVNSQIEAYTLKHNGSPKSIDDLISEGFIKDGQKNCKSGETISISNGEAVAN